MARLDYKLRARRHRRPSTVKWFLILGFLCILAMEWHGTLSVMKNFHGKNYAHQRGTVLVTGGMGNIGLYLVRDLLSSGHAVKVVDLQESTTHLLDLLEETSLSSISSRFTFYKGDIRNASFLSHVLKESASSAPLTGIVHLAAISRVATCLHDESACRSVNVAGLGTLFDSLQEHLQDALPKAHRPWFIFTSSREIYGSTCTVQHPCNETSSPNPLNLYGETKWEGEELIRRRAGSLFRRHIIFRLSSVYGGLYDLPERLIPSLAVKSMLDTVVTLNGGSQIFDFVHISDVVSSITRAVDVLERSPPPSAIETSSHFLLCSGQSTTALEVLRLIREASRSKSTLRLLPSDARYPDIFVCNNTLMKTGLGVTPFYSSITEGLGTYMASLYSKELRLLQQRHSSLCTNRPTVLNPSKLDGCSVFITAIAGKATYLKHISYPQPTNDKNLGTGVILRSSSAVASAFRLEYEGQKGHFVSFNGSTLDLKAVADNKTGGYLLFKASDERYVLGDGFAVTQNVLSQLGISPALPVSLTPYSCPPAAGKARLPTDFNDPWLYLLHQITPTETNLPSENGDEPLYCRRYLAAMTRCTEGISSCRGSARNTTDGGKSIIDSRSPTLRSDVAIRHHRPACDTDCALLGGCLNTGGCRCVEPLCALRSAATVDSGTASKASKDLDFAELLRPAVLPLFEAMDLPRVYVVPLNYTDLLAFPIDHRATGFGKTACFVADHFLKRAFESQETPESEADFIFIPFYAGWLTHHKHQKMKSFTNTLMENILKQLKGHLSVNQSAPLVIPITHDYGAAFNWQPDMRTFTNKLLRQPDVFWNLTVLSPFGDFNTLGYQPDKDTVIPPATCKTPILLKTFPDRRSIKTSSKRKYLVSFGGSAGSKTGSSARLTFMSGTLFPNSEVNLRTSKDDMDYMRVLNDSVFCPHVFGVTGWATRLSDAVYAGCIPVLTSDVTHPPFFDVLDWKKFSVFIDWRDLEKTESILKSYSPAILDEMQGWLVKVRDAFIYDPDALKKEVTGDRKGPIFLTLLSLSLKLKLKSGKRRIVNNLVQ